jgi:hypothetical protein
MIRTQKVSDKPHVYAVGDLVEISTNVLPLHLETSQKPKLLPKYIGPLPVVSVSRNVIQVRLPQEYHRVHDKFYVLDVRLWLHCDRSLILVAHRILLSIPLFKCWIVSNMVEYLEVFYHRKEAITRSGNCILDRVIASFLDLPRQYLAVHKDQSTDWVRNSALTEPRDVQLVKAFEKTFPRSEAKPCNPVQDYGLEKIAHWEDGISDDELDLAAAEAVDAHYGA